MRVLAGSDKTAQGRAARIAAPASSNPRRQPLGQRAPDLDGIVKGKQTILPQHAALPAKVAVMEAGFRKGFEARIEHFGLDDRAREIMR